MESVTTGNAGLMKLKLHKQNYNIPINISTVDVGVNLVLMHGMRLLSAPENNTRGPSKTTKSF